MEKFNTDFDRFWGFIHSGNNFSFSRYADGEVMLMKGISVSIDTQAYRVDKWSSPNYITKVGEDLLNSLNHTEENYFYAISAPTDNIHDYQFLSSHIKQTPENITFVNLWINANYSKTVNQFNLLKRPVFLICNEKANINNFPFKVSDFIPFPNNCINFWEENNNEFLLKISNEFKNKQNELVFISCGPISEIIIDKLYLSNPNNTYIDVGSSIDEFVHGYKTRPYMDNSSIYSQMISSF